MVESARADEDMRQTAAGDVQDGGNPNNPGGGELEEHAKRPGVDYSVPAVLHFIQHEWARTEKERAQWETEKAELQARIAFLEGERKGQINLKNDLVRRIKMLEYALRQERAKSQRLQSGREDSGTESSGAPGESGEFPPGLNGLMDSSFDPKVHLSQNLGNSLRRGRDLLRQYLNEIGYTDVLFEVRSKQIRSLLGLKQLENEENSTAEDVPRAGSVGQGDEKRAAVPEGGEGKAGERPDRWRPPGGGATQPQSQPMGDSHAEGADAVLSSFDFLSSEDASGSDEEEDDSQHGLKMGSSTVQRRRRSDNFLATAASAGGSLDGGSQSPDNAQRRGSMGPLVTPDLGELAELTMTSETDEDGAGKAREGEHAKLWRNKFVLRNHFDCVRAAIFLPNDSALVTASDDGTLKLWNLQRPATGKKPSSMDLEPIHTFRGHTEAVLCVAVNSTGSHIFSGSVDNDIRKWAVPDLKVEPYEPLPKDPSGILLTGHSDAVWSLVIHPWAPELASASSDGTVGLWDTEEHVLLKTIAIESTSVPTSLDFIRSDATNVTLAVGTKSGSTFLLDIEGRKKPVILKPVDEPEPPPEGASHDEDEQEQAEHQDGGSQKMAAPSKAVNVVLNHPTLPILLTGHADKKVRFWDVQNGAFSSTLLAHTDEVTSISIDSTGLYLLSGSHDCSWRIWNLETKLCSQEMSAHWRTKDCGVLSVAFHPNESLFVTAGADGLAKVFELNYKL